MRLLHPFGSNLPGTALHVSLCQQTRKSHSSPSASAAGIAPHLIPKSGLAQVVDESIGFAFTSHPCTKIEHVERELGVSRITAMKYLNELTAAGFVRKQKLGKRNFYINEPLYALLSGVSLEGE